MCKIKQYSLKGDAYKNFINIAVNRSDAFGLNFKEDEEFYNPYFDHEKSIKAMYECKELFHLTEKYKEKALRFWGKVGRQSIKDFETYKTITLPLVRELEKFRIDPFKCFNTSNHVYKICNETKEFLLKPDSILRWNFPYPEDLQFYKDGYCWFYSTIHEKHLTICVDGNDDEFNFWVKSGIEFYERNNFDKNTDFKFKCVY